MTLTLHPHASSPTMDELRLQRMCSPVADKVWQSRSKRLWRCAKRRLRHLSRAAAATQRGRNTLTAVATGGPQRTTCRALTKPHSIIGEWPGEAVAARSWQAVGAVGVCSASNRPLSVRSSPASCQAVVTEPARFDVPSAALAVRQCSADWASPADWKRPASSTPTRS
jgi:hypothetical protein